MKINYPSKKLDTLRDFYFLSLISILMILIGSVSFLISDYFSFRTLVEDSVKEQNNRASRRFVESFVHTKYMAGRISRQILDNYSSKKSFDYQFIDNLLSTCRNSNNELIAWSTLAWLDKNYNVTVSSNAGIIKEPINISYRDYVPLTKKYPNQVHIGKPVIGVVSKLWSIPAGYGLVDAHGHYLGAVITGIVIDGLRDRIAESVSDSNVGFAIVDEKGEIMTQSENFNLSKAEKFLHKIKSKPEQKTFHEGNGFYQKIDIYPYGIVTFYVSDVLKESAVVRFCFYLIFVCFVIFGVGFIFFVFYKNLIAPVLELSSSATKISRGEKLLDSVPEFDVFEVNELAKLVREADKKNSK